MRTGVTFAIVVATLVALAVALTISLEPGDSMPPSHAEMRAALLSELNRLAGPNAIACGLIELDRSNAAALQCAEESRANARSFWIAADRGMDDSDYWIAIFGPVEGQYQFAVLDSSPFGEPQQRAEYTVRVEPCAVPKFSMAANEPLACESLARL